MLSLHQASFCIEKTQKLTVSELKLRKNDFLVVVGANGSGKSTFAKLLSDISQFNQGINTSCYKRIMRISFEQQLHLFETEWNRCNTDFIGDDESLSTTAYEFLASTHAPESEITLFSEAFSIEHLLSSPLMLLSSGEGRKLLLVHALLSQPELLILDEPFDGLDISSRQFLIQYLTQLHHQSVTIVLIVNRFDEIHPAATQIGWLLNCHLENTKSPQEFYQNPLNQQLLHAESSLPNVFHLPEPLSSTSEKFETIAHLKNIHVQYDDRYVLKDLNWEIHAQEHWLISGPNGCGKSTLLNLITGDNPQCYANDITLFDIKRGTGESIWDLKKMMGIVSPALHQSYRVGCSAISVILSGYYDSIGLYQTPGDKELFLAYQWLRLIGMEKYASTSFLQLSYGQQRLLLIVRALVKHPPLLILDEPLQGLDALNRLLVMKYVDRIIENSQTTLLFVSHHTEDVPACIKKTLQFIGQSNQTYQYQFGER